MMEITINVIISLKDNYPLVFWIKTTINDLCSEIVNQNDRLNDILSFCWVTRQPFHKALEGILQSSHTPFTCLPQRNVWIQQFQQVWMKNRWQPTCNSPALGSHRNVIRITTLWKTLMNTIFECTNFLPYDQHDICMKRSVMPTTSAAYAHILLNMVLHWYTLYIAFCSSVSEVHSLTFKKIDVNQCIAIEIEPFLMFKFERDE